MKLLIGLGNPGREYEKNRHNVGIMFLHSISSADSFEQNKHVFASVCKSSPNSDILAIPTTYMNDSGKAARAVKEYYKIDIENLYLIHDDLDLRIGEYKIQKGVGPKIHNGVNSVEESLGTTDFWRVRIGIDNRTPDNRIQGEVYVLSDFSKEEIEILHRVFENIKGELI